MKELFLPVNCDFVNFEMTIKFLLCEKNVTKETYVHEKMKNKHGKTQIKKKSMKKIGTNQRQ